VISAAPALRARGLAVAYRDATACVVQDFDIDIAPGEIVTLLGASGVGKSSLLRSLGGLQPIVRGYVEMEGQRLAGVHPSIAIAFQDPSLLPWLNLEHNVGYGLDFRRQPALARAVRAERVRRAIEEVGLAQARHLRPSQLSGGMVQRAALARCLARQPRVLLLDEPFGALDEVTRTGMQQLLLKVVGDFDTATLLITHDIDEALTVSDRILLLGGTPATVIGTWTIDAPHPREDHLAQLGQLRVDILTKLHQAIRDASSVQAAHIHNRTDNQETESCALTS
jgi:NitT/TauT family transport system ATP-binding protein